MFQKILVPLDGSSLGEAALPYVEGLVAELSPKIRNEITLYQAVASMPHYAVVDGEDMANIPLVYTEKEIEQFKKQAADYLNEAGENLRSKGVDVRIMVGVGEAAEGICRVADDIDADLVAMSTHGRSGISRWAFGSIADRVLRAGKAPVLIVRPAKEAKKA